MTPKISIIIPVYNVEKYLVECLDSVLAQTFNDFECIVIDDGSPDNCPAICDEYARKDNRIKVIHKKNGGVSSARNVGLDAVRGEWVVFVDSDDWIDKRYLEVLYANAIKQGVDVSIGGTNAFKNGTFVRIYDIGTFETILNPESIMLRMFDRKQTSLRMGWCKLFKAQFIKDGKIRFDEAVMRAEDTLFFYNLYSSGKVAKIYFTPQPLYIYRHVDASITNQVGFSHACNTAIDMYETICQSETNEAIKQKIHTFRIHRIYQTAAVCILKNQKDDAFQSKVHALKKHVFEKNALPLMLRCKIFVLVYLQFVTSCWFYMKGNEKK